MACEAEEVAERLADAQLLDAASNDAAGQVRYRFHDLLRLCTRERLAAEERLAARLAALERTLQAYYARAGIGIPAPASPAILGVLAIIAGILYVSGVANSVHLMVGSVHHGHHQVRAAVSFVAGVALLAGAWLVARPGSRRT